MKKKFTILTIVLIVIMFFLFLPCDLKLNCQGNLSTKLQYPFVWVLSIFLINFFGLMLNDTNYKIWVKTSILFLLFSMLIIFITPETARGLMLNPNREIVNWLMLIIYALVSFVYIIRYLLTIKK
jgi:hypothetical protein